MPESRSTIRSPYMEFAKLHSHARYSLATSGVMNYPLADLAVSLADLEVSGPSYYGYEPLLERLAAKCGTRPECVVHATGTSMANHLAMAASFEPGDEVLIEQPTYELVVTTAQYLGAAVQRFQRRFEQNFRLDPEEVERHVTPRTRLIVVTNLHNPSGALADETTLRRVGEIAAGVGARVLVDEVYLEADFSRRTPSAFHLDETRFIITSSLTKAYGLSGLRCGWALAEPEMARRMWRINDLYGVIPAHAAERLSVIALDNLDRISRRAQALLETNRILLHRFFDSRRDLAVFRPNGGTIAFPRLLAPHYTEPDPREGPALLAPTPVDRLCDLLREKYETSVAPGRFFEMPDHFRLGIGGSTEITAEALARLGAALDELAEEVESRESKVES
ncbi:MAG TPA: aminotransferase class I/II-fold pyridoxal phosphate-dependent enzyme [Terriglobia bacterium]|nr:aminotransferase class I/II-fold pyridoxal phosphate-dependent enzyme [Terriglobia bacterium]